MPTGFSWGVVGFDLEHGPTPPDVLEARLNGLLMTVVSSIEQIHRLITYTKAQQDLLNALRARGIEVIQA
jgi:hypothetical protein